MKKTVHYKGHRWTNEEIKLLMKMWGEERTIDEIGEALNTTRYALNKMVTRLRNEGVPLKHRTKGNTADRAFNLWSQGEVEYLVRRRQEKATAEEIASELGRTYIAVQGMIQKLRKEGVNVPMRGNGVRRKWCPLQLNCAIEGQQIIKE